MVHGLKLVEQKNAQLADMFGVRLIFLQAASEAARADKELACGGIVAMRLRARKRLARNFVNETLTEAHAGNGKVPDVQVAPERDESDRGDGRWSPARQSW